MDELTKQIQETQAKLIQTLNESGLHPMILRMMLEGLMNQLIQAMQNQQEAPK